jgi:peptidoglycan L-alanyl-D-glutamate endopeptidase CwlK
MKAPAAYLMRSATLIRDLDPVLQVRATELVKEAYSYGIPIIVASGRRTKSEQAALYAQGRSQPGAVVTDIKPGHSMHERGLAFDVAPLDPHAPGGMGDVIIPWPSDSSFWTVLGRIGENLGLLWGGRFLKPDYPHFYVLP